MTQLRRSRASMRDPYSSNHSTNSGIRVPHADKIPAEDPDRAGILIELHRFELAGVEIDDRAVEIATKLTRWRAATAQERREEVQREREQREAEAAGRDCWVYYVRCGSLVKIGMTTNLDNRFAALHPNEILAIEPGGAIREAEMHARFAAMQAGGEYFHPGAALQEHIIDLRDHHGTPAACNAVVPDGLNYFPVSSD